MKTADTIHIYNGRIITGDRLIEPGGLLIEGNRVKSLYAGVGMKVEAGLHIDARENYISPGFIDLHVHGGGGHDFMDGTLEAFQRAAEVHAEYGTTSMLPTTLSCSREELFRVIELFDVAANSRYAGAQLLGLHLEGPYLAMSQRGAQDPAYIRDPDPEEYLDVLSRCHSIKRWSVAPELKGAMELGDLLREKGIIAAIAHTDAVYDQVVEAFEHGYTLATHLYSGMSGVTRRNAFRYAGVIESVLLLDGFDVEVIADGIHVPAPLLKLVYKIKGPDRIALITDAMRAAGMPPGESILGSGASGLRVIVEDGVAKLPDRSSFAGSVATANRLVRNMVELAGISLIDSVKMMTETPARILALSQTKGKLAPDADADVIVFDDHIDVHLTIVGGEVVFNRL